MGVVQAIMVSQGLEELSDTPITPGLVAAYLIFFMSSCGTLSWIELAELA